MGIATIRTKSIYLGIIRAIKEERKLFAILIDPEDFVKMDAKKTFQNLPTFTTHILVGGSTANAADTQTTVAQIKKHTTLPVILFPGDHTQIAAEADALLFLSLLSGNNPEYLIGQQVKSVKDIKATKLEVIPTGYILIDGGKETAVQRVSATTPLDPLDAEKIIHTALAGQYSGKKLIYLEAGSGAKKQVPLSLIRAVKKELDVPLIVGGGIRSIEQMKKTYEAGADLIVVGTAFEEEEFK